MQLDGIPGLDVWPTGGYVCHEQPAGNVTLVSSRLIGASRVDLIESSEVIESFNVDNHTIVINNDALTNATGRKLTLRLYINGTENDGYIIFLPRSEEIEFKDGSFVQAQSGRLGYSDIWACTEPVDISDVTDIIYTGVSAGTASPLYAYGDDGEAVRSLMVIGSYDRVHIVPDGSYRYVRASAIITLGHSLSVIYRDRRRH